MPEPIAVALTACLRPRYLRKCLAALAACPGVEDAILCAHAEPGCEETRALIEGFAACEVRAVHNPTRLGVMANTAAALRAAVGAAGYVVALEQDVVAAPDFLAYHRWARGRYRGDAAVGSVGAYHRRPDPAPAAEHHAVARRCWFHGWGAGFWADRLEGRLDALERHAGWDGFFLEGHQAGGLVEVYPLLSRVQVIGLDTTVQTDPTFSPAWYMQMHMLRHWAGQVEVAPGEFAEVS